MNKYIDYITTLPNREKLILDLENNPTQTLFLLNIDFFKEINNFFGNEFGNLIITNIHIFLLKNIKQKNFVLYKMTGGEFAILTNSILTNKEISFFIKKLNSLLDKKIFGNKENKVYISFTTGISTSLYKNILSNANMALKEAKEQRKFYIIFDKKDNYILTYENNIKWNKKVKEALKENRIVCFFQPILNIKTNKIEKYESLIRLVDENGTIIGPSSFLDISKRNKFYSELTKKTIENSFNALEKNPDKKISINISYQDILTPEIRDFLLNKIKNFKFNNNITFEVLESERISDFQSAAEFLNKIKSYGIKVAIDDFGSGFSNFDYLLNLDVDYVKIDSSLIKNIDKDINSAIIVESIVFFCKKLNIKTVAEYVCNESIFNKIKELDIDYAQGYYIAEPKKDFEK